MSWFGNRSDERFSFRRVTWPGWLEGEDYWQITGGEIELSAFSDLKAAGTLSFEGDEPPDDRDLVRIYYSFTDDKGTRHTEAMATLFVECTQPTRDGRTVHGRADCYSVLRVLSDKQYGMPFTVTAGTQAVRKAIELVESLGLRVNNPDPSAYTIRSDHTFDEDASYLEVVNWLLSTAGFASVWPDAYGTVQMGEYFEPADRPTVMEFTDDERSIMYPEVAIENDWASTPNTCRLYFETEEESLWACAQNVDPESRSSLVSRGREKTLFDTVSELAGSTQEARIANLKAMSRTRLIDNSAEIEYVAFQCAWVPLSPNDSIGVVYRAAGLEWKGAITNMRVELGVAVPCRIEARRFVRTNILTTTQGGAI